MRAHKAEIKVMAMKKIGLDDIVEAPWGVGVFAIAVKRMGGFLKFLEHIYAMCLCGAF